MKKIGITGGIGAGKSLICKIFKLKGIPVYDADYYAKWIMHNDKNVKSEVLTLFGDSAYQDGALNRKYIASIVFKDKDKLATLNSIVHPAVAKHSEEWMEAHHTFPYVLKEAALLIESGSYQSLDQLILVSSNEETRIQRVMKRDGVDAAEVKSRIARQMPENEKVQFANHVIFNNDDQLVIPQINTIHDKLLNE